MSEKCLFGLYQNGSSTEANPDQSPVKIFCLLSALDRVSLGGRPCLQCLTLELEYFVSPYQSGPALLENETCNFPLDRICPVTKPKEKSDWIEEDEKIICKGNITGIEGSLSQQGCLILAK